MKQLFENWRKHTISEEATLKIPVERYDAFKRKIEQWAMLFNKFAYQARDLTHHEYEPKTQGPRLLKMVNKLDRELYKIMGEFDLQYKTYQDERHAALKKLDQFDDDNEYFVEEGIENITPENLQIAVDAFKQVATNLAPAVVLPALMMAYKELKMNKANKES
tara:strand:+ start:90 stop:578 length:489 start_codon:yes stop_codon:yes gene_type:complete